MSGITAQSLNPYEATIRAVLREVDGDDGHFDQVRDHLLYRFNREGPFPDQFDYQGRLRAALLADNAAAAAQNVEPALRAFLTNDRWVALDDPQDLRFFWDGFVAAYGRYQEHLGEVDRIVDRMIAGGAASIHEHSSAFRAASSRLENTCWRFRPCADRQTIDMGAAPQVALAAAIASEAVRFSSQLIFMGDLIAHPERHSDIVGELRGLQGCLRAEQRSLGEREALVSAGTGDVPSVGVLRPFLDFESSLDDLRRVGWGIGDLHGVELDMELGRARAVLQTLRDQASEMSGQSRLDFSRSTPFTPDEIIAERIAEWCSGFYVRMLDPILRDLDDRHVSSKWPRGRSELIEAAIQRHRNPFRALAFLFVDSLQSPPNVNVILRQSGSDTYPVIETPDQVALLHICLDLVRLTAHTSHPGRWGTITFEYLEKRRQLSVYGSGTAFVELLRRREALRQLEARVARLGDATQLEVLPPPGGGREISVSFRVPPPRAALAGGHAAAPRESGRLTPLPFFPQPMVASATTLFPSLIPVCL